MTDLAMRLVPDGFGLESSERLGRRRWVIEETMSWLSGHRRLTHRYERDSRNYLAFLRLAAALRCYKRLVRLTSQDTVSRGRAREALSGSLRCREEGHSVTHGDVVHDRRCG